MSLAAQYSNRELVPDHPQIIAGWHSDAQAFRARAKADVDHVLWRMSAQSV